MNRHCRIGKVKMKNGGADVRIIPCSNKTTLTVSLGKWGEVVFRDFECDEICRRDALYMLRACEDKILRGDVK
jgi:hypothetical protein